MSDGLGYAHSDLVRRNIPGYCPLRYRVGVGRSSCRDRSRESLSVTTGLRAGRLRAVHSVPLRSVLDRARGPARPVEIEILNLPASRHRRRSWRYVSTPDAAQLSAGPHNTSYCLVVGSKSRTSVEVCMITRFIVPMLSGTTVTQPEPPNSAEKARIKRLTGPSPRKNAMIVSSWRASGYASCRQRFGRLSGTFNVPGDYTVWKNRKKKHLRSRAS